MLPIRFSWSSLDDDVIELEVAEGDVGKIIGRQGAPCGPCARW
jgi:predicted RNA-binding protein YlqC (UPF0109 family)